MRLGLETRSISTIKALDVTRLLTCGGALRARVMPFTEGQSIDVFGELSARTAPNLNLNVSTLEDVFLLVGPGQDGAVFDADGYPIAETLPYSDLRMHRYPLDRLRNEAEYLTEPLFLAFDPSWRNYYHWTIIGLGRAMLYNRYCTNHHATIVFDRTGRTEMGWPIGLSYDVWRNSLRRSGVFENCIFLRTGIYKVRRLDVMWMSTDGGDPVNHPPHISFFRELYDEFGRLFERPSKLGTENFIIARPHDPRLSAEGAIALRRLADTADYRFVTLDHMRLEEQLKLFASARIVVAPHGAGLSNIVYAPPSATILELNIRVRNEKTLRPWFYLIAAGMAQGYSYIDLDRYEGDSEALYRGLLDLSQRVS